MKFDKESFLKTLGKKPAKAKAEEKEDDKEAEPTALRPGKQLRAALAAKDDDAIEEAIRACVEGYDKE